MKYLCIGDIHIKPTNTHLVDLLQNQVINTIQNHSVECVVLLGDILDTFERIHTQALNRAYEFIRAIIDLEESDVKVYILVGNHDLINNQQFLSTQHWMNALKQWKNVQVVDKVCTSDDSKVCFVPYVPTGRFVEALETCDNDWKLYDYIFAHQEFKGCKMGAVVSTEGDDWQHDWPMIISGHIHDRQTPQPNLYYIGASIQNSFGDQTTPILLLLDTNNESHSEPQFYEIPIDLPKKKTIYTKFEEVLKLTPQNLVSQNTDMIRVVVKCDYDQFKVFTQTKEYEDLIKDPKCKIVHKPLDRVPYEDSVECESISNTEHDILFEKVLRTRNEYLFSVYMNIIQDTELVATDILIV